MVMQLDLWRTDGVSGAQSDDVLQQENAILDYSGRIVCSNFNDLEAGADALKAPPRPDLLVDVLNKLNLVFNFFLIAIFCDRIY